MLEQNTRSMPLSWHKHFIELQKINYCSFFYKLTEDVFFIITLESER